MIRCQFFKVSTSSCLREVVARIRSIERGTISLCEHHREEQIRRDYKLRQRVMPDILAKHEHTSGCINTFPDCGYPDA